MASFSRKSGIVGALVIAGVLIGGAYLLSGNPSSLFDTQTANAESTQQLLQSYSQKDSDGDGLPDWEEALYGTDPNNPHSFSPTLTDGQAVAEGLIKPKFSSTIPTASTTPADIQDSIPGQIPAENTLTAQFSEDFLQSYISASNGQQLSSDDEQALVTQLMGDYTAKAQALIQSQYTLLDVHTSSNADVSTYAGEVEQLIQQNDVAAGDGNPVDLMQAYMENNDMTAKVKLQTLETSYTNITAGLLAISAPPQLAGSHLLLIQSFDTLAKATQYVISYQQDPVATMGAISIYKPAADAVVKAISDIATQVIQNGEPSPGDPGYILVQFARAQQQP
jgi:hypothetical protein